MSQVVTSPEVIVHWLRPDPKGPVRTPPCQLKPDGGRFSVACTPLRTNVVGPKDVCSGAKYIVTCSRCRQHPEFGEVVVPEVAQESVPESVRELLDGTKTSSTALE